MIRSSFGLDWRKSSAHLLLLTRVLEPCTVGDFAKSDNWKEVLKEPPQQAIRRFTDEGMIVHANLGEHLGYKFKVNELKNFLKQRGLAVSGRKDDLVTRLVEADPDGMKEAVAGLNVLRCTEQGRAIAEQYLNSEKEKRAKAEQKALDTLMDRKFREASQLVAAFEAEQVFPRGLNIDWKNHNTSHDVEMLTAIFSCKPSQLSSLSGDHLEQVRLNASMRHLWGYSYGAYPLPPDFDSGLKIDNAVVANFLLSNAHFRAEITRCLKSMAEFRGVPHVISVFNCNDGFVCGACKKIVKEYSDPRQVPELPYEKCTSEGGCRCSITSSTRLV